MLDNKHVQDVVQQLQRLLSHLTTFYNECYQLFDSERMFPIEVDLAKGAFTYESVGGLIQVDNHYFIDQLNRMLKSKVIILSPFKSYDDDDEPQQEFNVAEEAVETSVKVQDSDMLILMD